MNASDRVFIIHSPVTSCFFFYTLVEMGGGKKMDGCWMDGWMDGGMDVNMVSLDALEQSHRHHTEHAIPFHSILESNPLAKIMLDVMYEY